MELIQIPIKSAKRTIVILSLALAGCRGPAPQVSPTPETLSLRLVADNATAPLLRDLVDAYHPPGALVSWNIKIGESNTVLDWVQNGEALYGLLGYLPTETPPRWMTPVGQRGVAFIVNPQNPLTNLSADQLRAVLQGQIGNWSALGGPNQPIDLIAREPSSSDSTVVQAIVLGERRIIRSARMATTAQAVVDLVSSNPGAMGYVSMGYLGPQTRALNIEGIAPSPEAVSAERYPIRSPIVFVGKAEPGNDAYRAFFAWVQSPTGQAVVRKAYGGLPAR